jgi:hypothetical protein
MPYHKLMNTKEVQIALGGEQSRSYSLIKRELYRLAAEGYLERVLRKPRTGAPGVAFKRVKRIPPL